VRAGGGDLEGALGVGLAPDIGEVELVRDDGAGRRGARGDGDRLAVEELDRVLQRFGADDAHPLHGHDLLGVVLRDEQRPNAFPAARQADGEGAADGTNLSVEGELTDDGEAGAGLPVDGSGRGQDAEGDRKVEGGALLAQSRRRQVDRDAIGRKCIAGIPDRGADALPALPHGGIRQTHRGEDRQPARDVDLDPDQSRLDPDQRRRKHVGDHGAFSEPSPSPSTS
jgi:hypothetical protein